VVRIALGQVNTTVGDLDGNVATMAEWATRATEAAADLVCFPELAVTGYPPEDLVLRPSFVDDNLEALDALARRTAGGCAVLTGFVDRTVRGLHNAAGLLRDGGVVARYHKVKLPNYGVFDEQRYFVPGEEACSVRSGSTALGISVCEDAWTPGAPFETYGRERAGAILNINGSPYHRAKTGERLRICADRARETGAWIVYVNAVGGQDELVFDGGSMVVTPGGQLAWHAAAFEEDLLVVDLDLPDAVRTLAMPSPYSSVESLEDATEVARRLGVRLDEVRIDEVFKSYLGALEDELRGTDEGLAEENLQARIRGNLLMALSNRFGSMVLATGNKSEYAVGYSTLYGDMAGGFAPIKDVPKTLVYELARWRNARAEEEGIESPIPDRVLQKPPSAELRPGQRDTDSLPPYERLDPIIEAYVEEDRSPEQIVEEGAEPGLVEPVVAMIDRAEYKRRQAAPGVKITPKAFGRDRRLPITNRYRAGS